MNSSSYIGRVGALAVALGIGAAVANSPAAWADDTASSTKHADSQANSPGTGHHKRSAATGPKAPTATGRGAARNRPVAATGPRTTTIATGTKTVAEQEPTATNASDETSTPVTPDAVSTSPAQAAKTAARLPAANSVETAVFQTLVQIRSTADNLMKAIATGLTSPVPNPYSSPALLLVEWYRRTLVGAVYNRAPVTSSLQIGEDVHGVVIGTVGAVDPDGDPLTYKVTAAPKYGTVVVHADGTYTYTPGTLLAVDGGTDSFSVEVRDQGLRLLSQAGVTETTVSVTVGAGDALGIGGTPFGVAMSADGRRAYVTDIANHRVAVVDIASGSVVDSINVGNAPYGIVVANGGRAYVVNSDDGTLSVIDTTSNTVLPEKIYVGNSPTNVAVNASGTRVIVTASNDDAVSIVDTSTLKVTRVEVGDGAFGVAVSGNKALVTNEFDDTVSVIDLDTNTVVKTIAVGDGPTGIAIGGNRAVITNTGPSTFDADGTVTLIDLDTLAVVGAPIAVGDTPTAVVVDATGRYAYISDMGFGTVSVLDLSTGSVVGGPIPVAEGVTGLAIGPDGRLYAAGSLAGTVVPVSLDIPATAEFLPVDPSSDQQVPAAAAATTTMLAAASRVTASAGASYTQGFDLYNYTTEPIKLVGYEGDERPDTAVPIGYVIPPGGTLHLEIPASFWSIKDVRAIFQNTKGDEWTVTMVTEVRAFAGVTGVTFVSHSGGTGTSTPVPDNKWGTDFGTTTIRFLEKRDTVIDVDNTQPAKQAQLLNDLCNSGAANCHVSAVHDDTLVWSKPQLGVATGGPAIVNNNTSVDKKYKFELTASQSAKTSLEGSVKSTLSLSKVFSAELSAKIGQEVTSSYTYKLSTDLDVPARTQVTVYVSTPMRRITADVQIAIGNTTINLKDVTFEVPDTRNGLKHDTQQAPAASTTSPA